MNIYKCRRAQEDAKSRGCATQGLVWTVDHYGWRLAQIDLTNLAARVKYRTSTIRPEKCSLFSVVLGRALCKACWLIARLTA